jgi:hypothetical protein
LNRFNDPLRDPIALKNVGYGVGVSEERTKVGDFSIGDAIVNRDEEIATFSLRSLKQSAIFPLWPILAEERLAQNEDAVSATAETFVYLRANTIPRR